MRFILFVFLLSVYTAACGQETYPQEIMEPVNMLFTGMNLGDSAMVHRAFYPDAALNTATADKEGKPVYRKGDLKKFMDAVGTPHDQRWNEPIWDVKAHVDGNLASVWVKYAFYLGNKFSHCGVDSFQLFKAPDGKWKIIFLVDTRQREGCEIPKEVSDRFK